MKKALIAASVLGLAGLAVFLWRAEPPKAPNVSISKVDVEVLANDKIRLLVEAELRNVWKIPLRALTASYQVHRDAHLVATGQAKLRRINPNDGKTLRIQVPVILDAKKLRAPGKNADGDLPTLTITGLLHLAGERRSIALPYRFTRQIPARRPKATLQILALKAAVSDDQQLAVDLELALDNPLPRPINTAKVDYIINVGQKKLASGSLVATKAIASKSTGSFRMPLTLDLKALKKFRESGCDKPLPLEVVANVNAKVGENALRFPLRLKKDLNPCAGQIKTQIKKITLQLQPSSILAKLSLTLSGKKLIDLTELQADIQGSLGEHKFLKAEAKLKKSASSADTVEVVIPLRLDARALRRARKKAGTAQAPLILRGTLSAKKGDMRLRFPIQLKKNVELNRNPIAISALSMGIIHDGDRLDLQPRILLKGLPPQLKRIRATYRVLLGGRRIANGRALMKAQRVEGQRVEGQRVEGQKRRGRWLSLNVVLKAAALKEAKLKHAGKATRVRIAGRLSVATVKKTLEVPFDLRSTVRLGKKPFKADLRAIAVRQADDGKVSLDAKVNLSSTLPRSIRNVKGTYAVFANTKPLAKGELSIAELRKDVATPVPIHVDINAAEWKRISAAGKSGTSETAKTLSLDIKGELSARISGKPVQLRFLLKRELPAQGSPTAKLKRLHVKALSKERIQLFATLALAKLPAQLGQSPMAVYDVLIDGQKLLSGSAVIEAKQDKGGAAATLVVTLNPQILKRIRKSGTPKHALLIRGTLSALLKDKSVDIPFRFEKPVFLKDKPFDLKLAEIRLKEMSPKEVKLEAIVDLRSKLPTKLTGLHISYQAKAKGAVIFSGKNSWKTISAQDGQRLIFPLTINTAAIKKAKAPRGKKTSIAITGQVVASLGSRTIGMSFETSKDVALVDKPFDVKIRKVKLDTFKFGKRYFIVDVAIKNNTPLNLKNVTIEGRIILAKGVEARVVDKKFQLKAGGTTRVNIRLGVERFGLFRLIAKRPNNGGWKLHIKGETASGNRVESNNSKEPKLGAR